MPPSCTFRHLAMERVIHYVLMNDQMMAECWPFGNMKQDQRDHNALQNG